MQLPGGTTVRAGIIPARPVDTAHGRLQVDALGLIVNAPWAGLRLLHPWRVTVTRLDGASEKVPCPGCDRPAISHAGGPWRGWRAIKSRAARLEP